MIENNIIKDINKRKNKRKWYDLISMSAETDINGEYYACLSYFKSYKDFEHAHIELSDKQLRRLRDWIDLFFATHRTIEQPQCIKDNQGVE